MKKTIPEPIKVLSITSLLLLGMGMMKWLPWWSFVIPVVLFGAAAAHRSRNSVSFAAGFAAGFMVWFGTNLYFDLTLGSKILDKMALLMTVPRIVVLFISGLTGGMVTGLAIYTGKCMVSDRQKML